jgi:hypothetical protein
VAKSKRQTLRSLISADTQILFCPDLVPQSHEIINLCRTYTLDKEEKRKKKREKKSENARKNVPSTRGCGFKEVNKKL